MRLDGFSPAYVPNRTTRPDAIAVSDEVARQQEALNRQGDALSGSTRPQTLQAVSQVQAQQEYERYQERKAEFSGQNLSWQNRQAMASYSNTAGLAGDEPVDAAQVLGLDLYA